MVLDADGLRAFLLAEFPAAVETGIHIEAVDEGGVRLVWDVGDAHLRPGGTVMGPTLMTLADTGAYLVILSRLGAVAQAVTSSLQIHFLRRPRPGRIEAGARLLKLGRRVAVVHVDLEGDGELVAVATVTYTLP